MKYLIFFFLFQWGTFVVNAQRHSILQDPLQKRDTISTIIHLHEVKVIAQENRSAATSSVIETEAIRHVQPFSLFDILQLLPGNTTPKVSFNTPRRLTIRHIGDESFVNSLGTRISIDGARFGSNNDLQQLPSPSNIFNFDIPNAQDGPDTREIATDNIASVEVIRGIPSVRYGDITSGMVIVHTRKEARPYSAEIRISPSIKSFSAGKGWHSGSHGVVNLSAGYTHTSEDNIIGDEYNRTTFQAGYTHQSSQLRTETGLSGYFTLNNNPVGITFKPSEYIRSKRQSYQFHFSGEWTPRYKALTSFGWQTSAGYAQSLTTMNSLISKLYAVSSVATDEHEQEGFFIPPNYSRCLRSESKPINANVALTATLRKTGGNWKSNSTVGVEWNSEGNRGAGKTSTIHTPSSPTRPGYDFRDIPFMHHYAVYTEENLQIGQGFRHLNIEGGIRLTGISVKGSSFNPSVEPRINLRYTALYRPEAHGLQSLQLKGGAGILRKMPTLSYLFTEPSYSNFINYRYRDNESGNQLAVVTTAISRKNETASLRLPQNFKAEIGFSGIFSGGFSFDITGFYEDLRHGFSTAFESRPFDYRTYNVTDAKGLQPEYRNGEVYLDGAAIGYTTDTTFVLSTQSGNGFNERKGGIEFILRSDYIPALATIFVLDGMWIRQRTQTEGLNAIYQIQKIGNKSYPFCELYELGNSYKLRQQFNTTLRAITEIPSIKLVTTIAFQAVWLERQQERIVNNAAHHFYMTDNMGNRVEGNVQNDKQYNKYVTPDYYMDTQGEIHRFTPELAENAQYNQLRRIRSRQSFQTSSYRPYFLLNLRVSKDIGKHVRLTFYANNLAKMNPVRYQAHSDMYVYTNPPAFFGAEMQIRF